MPKSKPTVNNSERWECPNCHALVLLRNIRRHKRSHEKEHNRSSDSSWSGSEQEDQYKKIYQKPQEFREKPTLNKNKTFNNNIYLVNQNQNDNVSQMVSNITSRILLTKKSAISFIIILSIILYFTPTRYQLKILSPLQQCTHWVNDKISDYTNEAYQKYADKTAKEYLDLNQYMNKTFSIMKEQSEQYQQKNCPNQQQFDILKQIKPQVILKEVESQYTQSMKTQSEFSYKEFKERIDQCANAFYKHLQNTGIVNQCANEVKNAGERCLKDFASHQTQSLISWFNNNYLQNSNEAGIQPQDQE